MVDEDHAEIFLATADIEQLGKSRELLAAELPGGEEGSSRPRARQSDQRQRAAPPHEWKAELSDIVVAHEIPPVCKGIRSGAAYIVVMVAGHQRHLPGPPQRFQPDAGRLIFLAARDVDEIAGDSDVVGCARAQVRAHALEHFGTMNEAAVALPVDETSPPLADELSPMRPWQGCEMRVGDMRENEHRRLPWELPGAKLADCMPHVAVPPALGSFPSANREIKVFRFSTGFEQ